jgi:hypothetical protein
MFLVLQGGSGSVRLRAYGLPGTLAVTQTTKVVDALLMGLGLPVDQGIPSPEGVVTVPNRVQEGVVSIAQTHSNVEADFQRSHRNSSI